MTSILGAIAVIATSIVTWGSGRLTKEGRLLLRVERLGKAFALLPDSPEKSHFAEHLRDVASELNNLLDNKKNQRIQRNVSTWSFIFGVIAVLILLPFINLDDPWQGVVAGSVIGLLIAGVTILTSIVLARQDRRQSQRTEKEREAAAHDRLLERLTSPPDSYS